MIPQKESAIFRCILNYIFSFFSSAVEKEPPYSKPVENKGRYLLLHGAPHCNLLRKPDFTDA